METVEVNCWGIFGVLTILCIVLVCKVGNRHVREARWGRAQRRTL